MNRWKKLFVAHKEIIMYMIVGLVTTVFSWVVYALFESVMPMFFANALSWFVTVVFAYITNKILVFESRSWKLRVVIQEAVAFFGARGLTGVFEIVAQPAFYAMGLRQAILGVDGLVSKVLVSAIVMVLNYVCSKLFVFRNRREKKTKY